MQTKKNMEIHNENTHALLKYVNGNNMKRTWKYTRTIKFTNFRQQTLPHLYMPYIQLGTVANKL